MSENIECLTRIAVLVALVAFPLAADAQQPCTIPALSTLKVANLTISYAKQVPASPPNPEYCDIRGSVRTDGEGAGPGSAGVEIKLPANWNRKFLF